MLAGAAWVDDPMPQSSAGFPAPGPETGGPPLHSSPLMTKLYQESGLRLPGNAAVVNPETARVHGFKNGGRATVDGLGGGFAVQVAVQLIVDPAVMPGVVEVAGRAVSPASIRRA